MSEQIKNKFSDVHKEEKKKRYTRDGKEEVRRQEAKAGRFTKRSKKNEE